MSDVGGDRNGFSHAQTNIQLFNQLQREGYSREDLVCVHRAYELARCLLTGRYLAPGKTFIAHSVGTTSILCSLHLPVEMVVAGLLHNVYREGDFGYGPKNRISEAKREQVRSVVGEKAEERIPPFLTLRWDLQTLPTLRDHLDAMDVTDRDVIVMKLASELEHYLDFDILYFHDAAERLRHLDRSGPILVEIAGNLGFPALAAEFAAALRRIACAEVPAELRSPGSRGRAFVTAPLSYRKRLSLAFYQEVEQRIHRHLHRRRARRARRS